MASQFASPPGIPVGTIISCMALPHPSIQGKWIAPDGYLVCDGESYNQADYPALASLLTAIDSTTFGTVGGSTFNVPDLRGEFLRGVGTNSRTNQGSGESNTGSHQDATIIPNFQTPSGGDRFFSGYESTLKYPIAKDTDYEYKTTAGATNNMVQVATSKVTEQKQLIIKYTAKPTNTSVLFCIKY